MKLLMRLFSVLHATMAALFALAALVLMAMAAREGFIAVATGFDANAAQSIIEAMGLLAAAVVALQIAQTIAEEEVMRDALVSGPTRVRRYLSRFMVVIVVALGIEGLVGAFRALHEDLAHMAQAASMVAATALLLAGWGAFVFCNRRIEELEPEAMEEAKSEDHKLDG